MAPALKRKRLSTDDELQNSIHSYSFRSNDRAYSLVDQVPSAGARCAHRLKLSSKKKQTLVTVSHPSPAAVTYVDVKAQAKKINPSSPDITTKRRDTLSSPTSGAPASRPLTKENLHILNFGMPPPSTPKGKGTQLSTPTTSPSKSGKTSSTTHDKMPLHLILETNHMPVKDQQALKRYPEVLRWARSVQSGERGSAMKVASEERLRAERDEYEKSNEDTFIHMFMAALKKKNRKRWNETKQKWQRVDWGQDGLKEAWNQIDTSDKGAKEILDKHPRVKNPKPDIVWGLSPGQFDKASMEINKLYYSQAGICPANLWHPFCIPEAKMKGSIEEAIYQCARGGSALVHASRVLFFVAGLLDLTAPGADLTTPVFSLAVVPTTVSLLVHWAEVDDCGAAWYHTSHVFTYGLENPGVGKQLRRDLDNILDWGTLTRKAEVMRMLSAIVEGRKNGNTRQLPTPDVTERGDDGDKEEVEDSEDVFLEEMLEEGIERGLVGPESPSHVSKRIKIS